MLQGAEETTGVKTPLTPADAGYHSAAGLQECAERGQRVAMPESPRGMALDYPYHQDDCKVTLPSPSAHTQPVEGCLFKSAMVRQAHHDWVGNRLAGLVQAHQYLGFPKFPMVDIQHVLHGADEFSTGTGRDVPALLQPRLEPVFSASGAPYRC